MTSYLSRSACNISPYLSLICGSLCKIFLLLTCHKYRLLLKSENKVVMGRIQMRKGLHMLDLSLIASELLSENYTNFNAS